MHRPLLTVINCLLSSNLSLPWRSLPGSHFPLWFRTCHRLHPSLFKPLTLQILFVNQAAASIHTQVGTDDITISIIASKISLLLVLYTVTGQHLYAMCTHEWTLCSDIWGNTWQCGFNPVWNTQILKSKQLMDSTIVLIMLWTSRWVSLVNFFVCLSKVNKIINLSLCEIGCTSDSVWWHCTLVCIESKGL